MSQDFKQARFSTHEKLAGKLDELARGQDIKSLESFAKAYLGMYLDIDSELLPAERVSLLADDDILDSIWSGFHHVLYHQALLSPEDIGCLYAEDERMAQGYIALAAIDREIESSHGKWAELLPDDLLESLICFHYVDKNELKNQWMDYAVQQRPQVFSMALLRFWQSIQNCGVERYPGFREIIQKQELQPVLKNLVLPVLQNVRHINKKLLPALLLSAFEYVPHADLLRTCQRRLEGEAYMSVKHHVYWLSSAFLLEPDQYRDTLFEYVGRTREKALPMLNFLESVIKKGQASQVAISASMLADLLYMIAPKFRPGRDQFGRMDDNVQKIIWLFDLLGQDSSTEGRQAIRRLRQIRVMRRYSHYLDRAEQEQAKRH